MRLDDDPIVPEPEFDPYVPELDPVEEPELDPIEPELEPIEPELEPIEPELDPIDEPVPEELPVPCEELDMVALCAEFMAVANSLTSRRPSELRSALS